jgi:hypothetical protein
MILYVITFVVLATAVYVAVARRRTAWIRRIDQRTNGLRAMARWTERNGHE